MRSSAQVNTSEPRQFFAKPPNWRAAWRSAAAGARDAGDGRSRRHHPGVDRARRQLGGGARRARTGDHTLRADVGAPVGRACLRPRREPPAVGEPGRRRARRDARETRSRWPPRLGPRTSSSRHPRTPPRVCRARPRCSSLHAAPRTASSRCQARSWRVVDLFELGDGAQVKAELDAYAALPHSCGCRPSPGMCRSGAQPWRRWRDGSRRAASSPSAPGSWARAGDANAEVFFQAHHYMSWLADERYEKWTGELLAFTEEKIKRSPAGLAYLAGIASCSRPPAASRGTTARSRSSADDFATVPARHELASTMASAAEVCASLAHTERAKVLRAARTLRAPHGHSRPRSVP